MGTERKYHIKIRCSKLVSLNVTHLNKHLNDMEKFEAQISGGMATTVVIRSSYACHVCRSSKQTCTAEEE